MFKILLTVLLVIATAQFVSAKQQATTQELPLSEDELIQALSTWSVEELETLSNMSADDLEILARFASLDWKETGTYPLVQSHSTLSVLEGYELLIGDDIEKFKTLTNTPKDVEFEAVIYNPNKENSFILFSNYKDGYLPLDAWDTLNSENLLAQVIENTKIRNIERKKNGEEEFYVTGWSQKPVLDKVNHTISWAIEGITSNETHFTCAVAWKFSREGYEKIVWPSEKGSNVPFDGRLEEILQAHRFDPGFRYEDYTPGDKVASYEIGQLMAGAFGGHTKKANGFTLFLQEYSGIICACLAVAFFQRKNLFKKKNNI